MKVLHTSTNGNFVSEKGTGSPTYFLVIGITARRQVIALLIGVAFFSSGIAAAEKQTARSSPYVPLDSWVYPALRRLAALGLITGQVADSAPWTRAECRRQIAEAANRASLDLGNLNRSYYVARARDADVTSLINDLEEEFPAEEPATEVRIASVYTRFLGIGGTPLRDSYHFGQSVDNDYGRPYGSGLSTDTGFSAYASASRFSFYVRAEGQTAPGRPAYSSAIQQFISTADYNPVTPSAIAKTEKFTALEMYVGVQIGPENVTFGKQSLWWGPGQDSAFAFTNNAAPFYMLRFDQTKALVLPGPLRHLGKIHTQFVFGEMAGHSWPAHPYVNAQKITFDLTDDFELGFTRSTFFGGAGHPLTWNSFEQSLFSTNSPTSGQDPGDRHSGFDFRWQLPGLHHYVTLYSDSYADDEPNPIDAPRRSAWGPGIYFTKLPRLRHFDLRVESYSTWLYRKDYGGNFIYWNDMYHDAYTNQGSLLGSWIGRDARAIVCTSRYWFSGKTFLESQYKQVKTGSQFVPGGGTQTDFSINGQFAYKREWLFGVWLQAERYDIPLFGDPRRDLSGWLQVTFTPRNWAIAK